MSNKKYILRSMPTTLLFSLLFSAAGTLPHLSSEDHLSATELAPAKTGWLRLVSFSSAHLCEQTKVLCISPNISNHLKRLHDIRAPRIVEKVCKCSFQEREIILFRAKCSFAACHGFSKQQMPFSSFYRWPALVLSTVNS